MVREVVAVKSKELYLLSILVGSIIFVTFLHMNEWNLSVLLSDGYMATLMLTGGMVLRVLSGIGIMLTYAFVCAWMFRLASNRVRGNPVLATRLRSVMLLPIVLIGLYGVLKLLGWLGATTDWLIEELIAIYGVVSLMLSVYIVPAAMNRYRPEFKESTKDKLLKHLQDARFSLWKGYQARLRKDYARIYAKEFERYGERLDRIREQLSGMLLLPVGIALIVIPPIALALFVLWLRSFTLDIRPLSSAERGFLLFVAVLMMFLGLIMFVPVASPTYALIFDAVYGVGILSSATIFVYVMITS